MQRYDDLLSGRLDAGDTWAFLETLPDSNGNVQGVTEGSFQVKREISKARMKVPARHNRAK